MVISTALGAAYMWVDIYFSEHTDFSRAAILFCCCTTLSSVSATDHQVLYATMKGPLMPGRQSCN